MRRCHPVFWCALLLAALRPAQTAVDPIYRAGAVFGRDLYWVPEAGLSPDTVDWAQLASVMPLEERVGVRSLDSALALLTVRGWKLVRVEKCSAIALGLLVDKGYRACVLSQWHAACNTKVMMPLPGMPQREMRHNAVSDVHWEIVKRADFSAAPSSSRPEYRIRLDFEGHGHSQWDGHDMLTRDNRQILGTGGLSVRIPELSYQEDLNVRRKLFRVYLIVKAEKKPKEIVRDVEKGMDALKLDLSYTVPAVVEVERAKGRSAPAAAAVDSMPAVVEQDSAAGDSIRQTGP